VVNRQQQQALASASASGDSRHRRVLAGTPQRILKDTCTTPGESRVSALGGNRPGHRPRVQSRVDPTD
jgi:hypothetical protein